MEEEDDIDAYMENGDILDFLPKEEELLEEGIFKISADIEQEHDRFIEKLPKLQANKENQKNNLDATMTTDHTNDIHEQEYDEDEEEELHIIESNKPLQKPTKTLTKKPESELSPKPTQSPSKDKDKTKNPLSASVNESDHASKQRIYQHPVSKPKFVAGRRHLSIAEARLFGLLTEDGELVDLHANRTVSPEERLKTKQYLLQMAQPKSASLPDEKDLLEKEGCTFAPQKAAQVIQAMKNKRCGYDFMDRINNRGSFLDRVAQMSSNNNKGATGNLSKAEYEAMKRDYDESLTKLQCPKCLKSQSFDEFINKKRVCTLCNLKFQKLQVSSGLGFLRKNQDYEKKRQEKLQEIEKQMYGEVLANKKTTTPPVAPPRPSSSPSPVRGAPGGPVVALSAPLQPPTRGDEAINHNHNLDEPVPSRPSSKTMRVPNKPPFPPPRQSKLNKTQPIAIDPTVRSVLDQTSKEKDHQQQKVDSKEVLAKILSLNHTRNQQAMNTLEAIQQQLSDQRRPSSETSSSSSQRKKTQKTSSSKGSETTTGGGGGGELPQLHKSNDKTKMSDKMERLFAT